MHSRKNAGRVKPLEIRLSEALSGIESTERQWFDGSVDSIHARRAEIDYARGLARQYTAQNDYDRRAMSAMAVEHDLGLMSENLRTAADQFVSDEVVEAQNVLPHYSINVLDY